ncbi:MAG TPA: hypothetical protein VFB99_01510 [Vicinamibacterales bacterium]|nr:hypothetical protein [Vicinamibacterales bacterium]
MSQAGQDALKAAAERRATHKEPPFSGTVLPRRIDLTDPRVRSYVAEARALGMQVDAAEGDFATAAGLEDRFELPRMQLDPMTVQRLWKL